MFGSKTINVTKSTNDTKRATFEITVTASGKVLKPLVVFKGKAGGRIERREFPTYCIHLYLSQSEDHISFHQGTTCFMLLA